MTDVLMVIDSSEIVQGKLEAVRTAIGDLVSFVEENEPRALAYSVYISDDETRMTVTQIHPDSESMELHMEVAASAFAGFKDLLTIRSMDVYGTPSPELLKRLEDKARMLGPASVCVHDRYAGFVRF